MIRVSTKFGVPLLLVMGAAAMLRLTALGDVRGVDPCASPDSLRATSLIPGTTALGERLEALDEATFQWSEGEVAHPLFPKLPMEFQIIRSYDAPSLYNNPLRFGEPRLEPRRAGGAEAAGRHLRLQPEELQLQIVEADGARLPIHLAWDHTNAHASRLVAWYFTFDNEPVRSPLAAQLRNSLSLAFGGPRPLTLVTLSAVAPPQLTANVEDAASAWLAGSWSYIARTCKPR